MTAWKERIATSEGTGLLISLGSVAGALGVASCCALPLAFAALGLGGAWLSGLSVLAPYQPILLAATLALLGAGSLIVYRRPAACAPGAGCAGSGSARPAKITLWTAAALALVGVLAG
jgi:mercuric ion transport protein